MNSKAYIISAKRSIVAPIDGALSTLELHNIASPVIKSCLKDAQISPHQVDELILSNALYGGGNPARMAALAAGLPETVAGLSIDRQCVGGLDAILLASQIIQSGAADIIIAGGAESYSRRPIRQRTFHDNRPPQAYDHPPFTPWQDNDPDMHVAAAALGKKLSISFDQQNEWAIHSHKKALANRKALEQEIATLPRIGMRHDPYGRKLSAALCARAPKIYDDITVANTAVAADAAAFCIVVSEKYIKAFPSTNPICIETGITLGADPAHPGLGPVEAIKALGGIDKKCTHFEVMEAYAAQAIACVQETGMDPNIVNQKGGALARGHPIGASGAILAVRLYHDLIQSGTSGMATIAAAGGLGTAVKLCA